MKPLLKWPGGKSRELGVLELLPKAWKGTWIEPFVGGGAAYFALEPAAARLNDVNPDLMGIYRGVATADPGLGAPLGALAWLWDTGLVRLGGLGLPALARWYLGPGRSAARGTHPAALEGLAAGAGELAEESGSRGLAVDPAGLATAIHQALASKLSRMRGLEAKHAVSFGPGLVANQLETGLRAGLYTYLRDRHRASGRGEALAVFWFLREFCYGSMFRQNRDGRFNIPYGGMAYNRKRLGPKLADLLSPRRRALLADAELCCGDFRGFFDRAGARLGKDDVCFLDPPYDSDFKEYDGHAFGERDQRELAEAVAGLPCRVLMIVKDTPLIQELYRPLLGRRRGLRIESYDRRYTYNVRGRNRRETTHLLITDL